MPSRREAFLALVVAGVLSAVGSGLTAFTLAVEALRRTGDAGAVGVMAAAGMLPMILVGPVGGVPADRFDRRVLMLLGDGGSGLCLLGLAALLAEPQAEIWQLAAATAASAAFAGLTQPALRATVSDLVPPACVDRAAGALQLAGAAQWMAAPALAGVLLTVMPEWQIVLIDAASFAPTLLASVLALLAIGRARLREAGEPATLAELAGGLRAIREGGLWPLLGIMTVATFAVGALQGLLPVIVLGVAGERELGWLTSIGASGMLAGSLLVGGLGVRTRLRTGLALGLAGAALGMLLAAARPELLLIGAGAIGFFLAVPLGNAAVETVLRRAVPNEALGRVWGLTGLLTQLGAVLAFVTLGPLADRVIEPALAAGAPAADVLARLAGEGSGRASALALGGAGVILLAAALAAELSPGMRRLDGIAAAAPSDAGPRPGSQRKEPSVNPSAVLRQLRRSGAAAILVVCSVLLATALAATGAIVAWQLADATGQLEEDARLPQLLQMHAGPIDPARIEAFAASRPEVVELQLAELATIDHAALELSPGQTEAASNLEWSAAAQNAAMDFILDAGTQAVAELEPGEAGVPATIAAARGIRLGDPVRVHGDELRVGALVRDAGMGSELASSRRLLVHEDDLERLRDPALGSEWLVEMRLADPGQAGAVYDAYFAAGLPADGPMVNAATFRLMIGLSDGLMAAVILVASALIGVVAALVLSLAVRTAVAGQLREIGVLRAIGVPGRGVGRIVLASHLACVAAGALLGAAIALAAAPAATDAMRQRLGGELGWTAPAAALLAAAIVWLLGWLIARAALRPALRRPPLEVMRGGARWAGRPRGKAGGRAARPAPAWLALGRAAMRRARLDHLAIAAMLAAAALGAALPVALRTTISSDEFMRASGIAADDVQVSVPASAGPGFAERLEAAFAADAEVARAERYVVERVLASRDGAAPTGLNVISGDHAAFPVDYLEGRAPSGPGEIALSQLNADAFEAAVGETLTLDTASGSWPAEVVGVYRDITYGGLTARGALPEGAGSPLWTTIQLDLVEGADPAAFASRHEAAAAPARVGDVEAIRGELLGGMTAGLGALAWASAGCSAAVTAVVTALALHLFLVRDRGRRGIAQAIGAPIGALRAEHRLRVLAPAALGALLGAGLAPVIGSALFGLAGRLIGTGGVELQPSLLLSAAVPLGLLAIVAVVIRLGARRMPPGEAAALVGGQDL